MDVKCVHTCIYFVHLNGKEWQNAINYDHQSPMWLWMEKWREQQN